MRAWLLTGFTNPAGVWKDMRYHLIADYVIAKMKTPAAIV